MCRSEKRQGSGGFGRAPEQHSPTVCNGREACRTLTASWRRRAAFGSHSNDRIVIYAAFSDQTVHDMWRRRRAQSMKVDAIVISFEAVG